MTLGPLWGLTIDHSQPSKSPVQTNLDVSEPVAVATEILRNTGYLKAREEASKDLNKKLDAIEKQMEVLKRTFEEDMSSKD